MPAAEATRAVDIKDKSSHEAPAPKAESTTMAGEPKGAEAGAAQQAQGSKTIGGGGGQGQRPGGAGLGMGGAAGGTGAGGGNAGGSLDRLPRIIEKVKPLYPEHARRQHKTGIVTLKFLVDAEGRVHQPSVVEALPEGLFEESALAAVAKWRFAPAIRQGRPVPTWLILPVRFSLELGQ
ncbi:MAG: energy transducer TonB [Humidesulfovibrio sp.]|nr:energy transducer TonB [Humidesulfovibrio sp.]